jgi:hypothetical protein
MFDKIRKNLSIYLGNTKRKYEEDNQEDDSVTNNDPIESGKIRSNRSNRTNLSKPPKYPLALPFIPIDYFDLQQKSNIGAEVPHPSTPVVSKPVVSTPNTNYKSDNMTCKNFDEQFEKKLVFAIVKSLPNSGWIHGCCCCRVPTTSTEIVGKHTCYICGKCNKKSYYYKYNKVMNIILENAGL